MNTANKITLVRVFLVPIFMFFLLSDIVPGSFYISGVIFIIAAITDTADGYIARKYNQITNFGKFIDPLADKLLVISALVGLVQLGKTNAVVVTIIIARELMVTSLRLAAADGGKVIAAGFSGKLKTVLQIIAICVIIYEGLLFHTDILGQIAIYIACGVTIYSGIEYMVKNIKYINFK